MISKLAVHWGATFHLFCAYQVTVMKYLLLRQVYQNLSQLILPVSNTYRWICCICALGWICRIWSLGWIWCIHGFGWICRILFLGWICWRWWLMWIGCSWYFLRFGSTLWRLVKLPPQKWYLTPITTQEDGCEDEGKDDETRQENGDDDDAESSRVAGCFG